MAGHPLRIALFAAITGEEADKANPRNAAMMSEKKAENMKAIGRPI